MTKLYPQTCTFCQSPARITAVKICSNAKCKMNRPYNRILKKIPPLPPVVDGRDQDGFLICPVCGERAKYDDGLYPYGSSMKAIGCANQHYWNILVHNGDRLYRVGYYFEWKNGKWEERAGAY